jgi:hypothetical protein
MCFLTFCYDLKVYPPNFEGLSSLILIDAACRKRNAALLIFFNLFFALEITVARKANHLYVRYFIKRKWSFILESWQSF